MNDLAKVTILGVRGSMVMSGAGFVRYGGASSCILLQIAGETIFLDAGSGISGYKSQRNAENMHILISHSHIDHIIGFLSFAPLFYAEQRCHIYGKSRGGLTIKEQLLTLISPPLWPTGLESFPAELIFHGIDDSFHIGEVAIDSLESNHPGGSTVYKITYGDKKIVYATDFEHDEYQTPKLAEFAADCSLLIYDAMFFDDEYPPYMGWGHSTVNEGLKLKQLSNSKRMLLFHHSPDHNDLMLDRAQEKISRIDENCSFAKCGEEIFL